MDIISNLTLPRIFLTVVSPNTSLTTTAQQGGKRSVSEQNENITSNSIEEILNDYTGSFGNSLISMYEMMKIIEATPDEN